MWDSQLLYYSALWFSVSQLKFLLCSCIVLTLLGISLRLLLWILYQVNHGYSWNSVSGVLSCSHVWNICLCFFLFPESQCWFLCIKQPQLSQSWWSGLLSDINSIAQLRPSSWRPHKPLWLFKLPSLILVASSSWGYSRICQCFKGDDCS